MHPFEQESRRLHPLTAVSCCSFRLTLSAYQSEGFANSSWAMKGGVVLLSVSLGLLLLSRAFAQLPELRYGLSSPSLQQDVSAAFVRVRETKPACIPLAGLVTGSFLLSSA